MQNDPIQVDEEERKKANSQRENFNSPLLEPRAKCPRTGNDLLVEGDVPHSQTDVIIEQTLQMAKDLEIARQQNPALHAELLKLGMPMGAARAEQHVWPEAGAAPAQQQPDAVWPPPSNVPANLQPEPQLPKPTATKSPPVARTLSGMPATAHAKAPPASLPPLPGGKSTEQQSHRGPGSNAPQVFHIGDSNSNNKPLFASPSTPPNAHRAAATPQQPATASRSSASASSTAPGPAAADSNSAPASASHPRGPDLFATPPRQPTNQPYADGDLPQGPLPDAQHEFRYAGVVTRDELKAMLSECKADITDATHHSVEALVAKYDVATSRRFAAVEANIQAVQHNVDVHIREARQREAEFKQRQDDYDRQLQELRDLCAASASRTAHKTFQVQAKWEEEPDDTIVRLSSQSLVATDAVRDGFSTFVADWMEDDSWKFDGAFQPLAKSWYVQFQGDPGVAKRRRDKFLQGLRKPDGNYHELWVYGPTGTQHKIFIARDKNGKQISTEIILRRAAAVGRELLPQLSWHFSRADSCISADWVPCMLVEPHPDKSFTLKFNPPAVQQFGIDKDVFRDAVQAKVGRRAADGVEWSL